jgi:CheY-like chemotaxis protein/DNA-directed RNA polymerase specialized sigma24 family protein
MSLGQKLAPYLPFLRRYARALTGSQSSGDAYVRATLQSIIDAPDEFPADAPRVGLFQLFHRLWQSSHDGRLDDRMERRDGFDDADIAHARLAAVTPVARQALLLSTLESFDNADIARIMDIDVAEVEDLIATAIGEIDRQTRSRVLIIEDEPIIAMDIETTVRDLGHDVVGIAVTRDEAVALARETTPGLVLADIQLADDSSGIDAVADILADLDVPVIFVTAFPERLLTGERAEPTFLITKPFQQSTLRTTIAQALFFDSATVPVA